MKVMNLGNEDEPIVKKKSNTRNLRIALGLAAVILVPTIGSTLAGGITVSGGSVEFGQGVVTTVACDDTITVTPTTVLDTGSAAFRLETIAVSGIAVGCDNLFFTFKALNSSNTAQVIGSSTATFCKVTVETVTTPYTAVVGDTCGTISAGSATGFILTPAKHPDTSNVAKITLESSTS